MTNDPRILETDMLEQSALLNIIDAIHGTNIKSKMNLNRVFNDQSSALANKLTYVSMCQSQDWYLLKEDHLRSLEYLTNPFYRLVYSKEDRYIQIFKNLKRTAIELGIQFTHKKRIDEAYIISLNLLLDEIMSEGYLTLNNEILSRILTKVFSGLFELRLDNHWAMQEFIGQMEAVIRDYCNIFELKFNGSTKVTFDVKDEEPDFLFDIKQFPTFDDYSDTEYAPEKKEVIQGNLGTEEDYQRFLLDKEVLPPTIIHERIKYPVAKEFQLRFYESLISSPIVYKEALNLCFEYLFNQSIANDDLVIHLATQMGDNFEAAIFMVEKRDILVDEITKALASIRENTKKKNKDFDYSKVASNITITKKSKQAKKKGKGYSVGDEEFDHLMYALDIMTADDEAFAGFESEEFKIPRTTETQAEDEEIDFLQENEHVLHQKYGIVRKERGLKIVFSVSPMAKSEDYRNTQKLRVSDVFPEYIHQIFKDSDHLNILQSTIHDTVFNTDENILCCAPTGAGKTNVALMAVARTITKHLNPTTGKVDTPFKIVYLSPLKALAAEIVSKFTSKLSCLGVKVRESTGDISLSKSELLSTHIIVSTPEKWDVMTRKSDELNRIISLLIIDEIHLLDDTRGRVLESLVARTIRLIESKQCPIRLVGLSATLPNYKDVANFLKVSKGLFYFNEAYRPVPLYKKFIGIKKPELYVPKKGTNDEVVKRGVTRVDIMNQTCYEILKDNMLQGKQVLVFVHSRKETVNFANYLLNQSALNNEPFLFTPKEKPSRFPKYENKDLKNLTARGIGCHNAGIKRKDRTSIEQSFVDGSLMVIVTTATLAWGINMPCHTVVIKGTDFYEPGVGFRPISLLDVQQIFGRAGRPQFDDSGEAVLITKTEDLNYFISTLSLIRPIESHFKNFMLEALLAEVVLGNITSKTDALNFIRSTFYYIRYCKSPAKYGVKNVQKHIEELSSHIKECLVTLHKLRLVRFDEVDDVIESTELGRIASHFYVNCETMEKLCYYLSLYDTMDHSTNFDDLDIKNILTIIAQSTEFEQISSKGEEEEELVALKKDFSWVFSDDRYTELYEKREAIKGSQNFKESSVDNLQKIVLLFWGYLYLRRYNTYSLESDTTYIADNGSRVLSALYEISLKENNAPLAEKCLFILRQMKNCVAPDNSPFRMFCFDNYVKSITARKNNISEARRFNFLTIQACVKLEQASRMDAQAEEDFDMWSLRLDSSPITSLHLGATSEQLMKDAVNAFPFLDCLFESQPISQEVIKVTIKLKPCFQYNRTWHQRREYYWVLVKSGVELLHHSSVSVDCIKASLSLLDQKNIEKGNFVETSFFLPFNEDAEHYDIGIYSDRFVDADVYYQLPLKHMRVEGDGLKFTKILNLQPLSIKVLQNESFVRAISSSINYFNPIQTQLFWAFYHTNENILLGAPTGTGKTLLAELAIFRSITFTPNKKIVYIAPYKSILKEKLSDWSTRFKGLGLRIEELSGDSAPDFGRLLRADVILSTPEMWERVSRNWQSKSYLQCISLFIIDEIHLLGYKRGSFLEMIVSRVKYMETNLRERIRMVGLSTAMATGLDIAVWFGVRKDFIFNFRMNSRPVPLKIHFKGFSEQSYVPRMNMMNRPAYNDIKRYANNSSTLIFVSSKKQTKSTALELISYSTNDMANASQFLRMTQEEVSIVVSQIEDQTLRHTLCFGIGIHHSGLSSSDRNIVESLFRSSKFLVLIATSTLAWGVNFPVKLVIIKGTEYYDGSSKTWVDLQVTDLLEMTGRAGRPQYNDEGIACIYIEKSKKDFYSKYLNQAFPVESSFHLNMESYINAEIVTGTIANKQECIEFIGWTYFFRRLVRNPAYYQVNGSDSGTIQKYLMNLIDTTINRLVDCKCVETDETGFELRSTVVGEIASRYLIDLHTITVFAYRLKEPLTFSSLLRLMADCEEFKQVSMRQNEDECLMGLSKLVPVGIQRSECDSPHSKSFLLIQAYLHRVPLPSRELLNDLKSILEIVMRLLPAMVEVVRDNGNLANCLLLMELSQMSVQGAASEADQFKNISNLVANVFKKLGVTRLRSLVSDIERDQCLKQLKEAMGDLEPSNFSNVRKALESLPSISLQLLLTKINPHTLEDEKESSALIHSNDEVRLRVTVKEINPTFSEYAQMKKLWGQKKVKAWLVVGCRSMNRILGIKQMALKKTLSFEFVFDWPETAFKNNDIFVRVVQDSYIGIDEEVTFRDVVKNNLRLRIN